MTAQRLLTDIYQSKEVDDVIKKLKPVDLQDDIKQHCFLELFEKPGDFILDLHARGKLKAYIVKILWNTATFKKSSFAKALGKETPTDFCEVTTFEIIKVDTTDLERLELYRETMCKVDELYWYKAELLKLYAELGTYQAVSDKTGIPLTSVYKTIVDIRKEIKKLL